MASEIRVDKINSLSGVGTVTLSPTGVDIAGITTAATLRATTGIITSLTAGSLTSLGAVSGTTGTFSAAVSGTTGTFTGDVDIADKIIHTGDTNTAIRFPEADTVTFETAGNEQVRIDNDVQMFVQGASRVSKLQLHREDVSIDADDVVGQITFTGRDSGGAGIQRVGAAISAVASNNWDTSQTTGYSATHLDFYTQAQQSAYSTLTPRLRIDSSGRLLIGTTTEGFATYGEDLTLATSAHTGITIRSGTSSRGSIYFSDGTSGDAEYQGYIQYNHSDGRLVFGTTGTERIRIDGSGNVGIGINAPTAASSETALHIYANEYPEVHLTSSVTGSNAGDGSIFTLNNDSSTIIRNQENSYIRFDTNGSNERMRILAAGGLTFNGDTAAANALDDYEEGTFTPNIQGTGANNAKTYVKQLGKYTKIGNQVHCEFNLAWNSYSSNDTGDAIVNGLPFTIDGNIQTGAAMGSLATNNCDYPGSGQVTAAWEGGNGQNYAYVLVSYDANAWQNPAASSFWGGSGNVRGQVSYRVQ